MRRASMGAVAVWCALATGCLAEEGFDPLEELGAGGTAPTSTVSGSDPTVVAGNGATSAGYPSGEAEASVSTGGSVGQAVCEPGAIASCYDGAPGTDLREPCRHGWRACLPDGTGFGRCVGQRLPGYDLCATEADEDCDGAPATQCTGFFALPPTHDAFAWQGVQDRFVSDGVPCTGAVALAMGDRAVCYAGADERLHCAGSVHETDFGPAFVDAGLDGPVQILISSTWNEPTHNGLCVVLRDGTMRCRGATNEWGQMGRGTTAQIHAFAAWGMRSDVLRAATANWGEMCVLTTGGYVLCSGYGFGTTPVVVGSGSSVWVDGWGQPHVDDPAVLRAGTWPDCQVRASGLQCQLATRGVPGEVVDGSIIGPNGDVGCLLDAAGSVECFSLESVLAGPYFEPGAVVAIATNFYNASICAAYVDGSLWCLGPNTYGELGAGEAFPLTTETMVAPPGSVRVGCEATAILEE